MERLPGSLDTRHERGRLCPLGASVHARTLTITPPAVTFGTRVAAQLLMTSMTILPTPARTHMSLPALLAFSLLIHLGTDLHAQHSCKGSRHVHQRQDMPEATFRSSATRSDSIDLLHQRITLDLSQQSGIAASCMLRFSPRVPGINSLPLDLIGFTVDGVEMDGIALSFSRNGELLLVELGASFSPDDTLEVTVHYSGAPATDPSGFGGFYLGGSVLYNLGVAFQSIPHSYGRSWFPCFDNFVEKNTYEFLVTTHDGRRAWCNGSLVQEVQLGGDTVLRHWSLADPIPAYLAAVSAASYTAVRDTLASISGRDVPVELVALPGDTTNMKNSFTHLPIAFAHFEELFGAFAWEKVGYVLTPLGAMEHATSIHYPRQIANGSLTYESIMAHELAHEWFGNLVTCARAEEMYLNEGFAEYLSHLFLEAVYGRARYMREVRDNHRDQVHRCHLRDNGHHALAEVPQTQTYGDHSYNKAAAVLHTLRSYMGDEAFANGLRQYMADHAMGNATTAQLQQSLEEATGQDLGPFFTDWILQPGWAAFEVDSFHAVPSGNGFDVNVWVRQKLRGADTHYDQVPVSLACRDAAGELHSSIAFLGGTHAMATVQCPFQPVQVWINHDERIALAQTQEQDSLPASGTRVYNTANMRLTVGSLAATTRLRMEQYWVAADTWTDAGDAYVTSPDRWWRVTGNWPEGNQVQARFTLDARPTVGSSLDLGLAQEHDGVPFHEDSVVVLHRTHAGEPWRAVPGLTTNNIGSPTDGWAFLEVPFPGLGDYCFAFRKQAVGVAEAPLPAHGWVLHPNPASDRVRIQAPQGTLAGGMFILVDSQGREVLRSRMQGPITELDLSNAPRGMLLIRYQHEGAMEQVGRLVVQRY